MIAMPGRELRRGRRTPHAARLWTVAQQAALAAPSTGHPLADAALAAALGRREAEIEAAFAAVEPGSDEIPAVRAIRYAHRMLDAFGSLVERGFDRSLANVSEGEPAAALIARWGFHAVDITPCADGRMAGVVDYILRVPPA